MHGNPPNGWHLLGTCWGLCCWGLCRRWLHEPVPWQQRQLSRGLRGHYAYYGIMGNYQALNNFHRQVTREWRKWLHRRSQKARMTWERFNRLLVNYPLLRPRIVHAI